MISGAIYGGLFLVSVIYAVVLQWLRRRFGPALDGATWLMVLVGDGYVVLALRWLVDRAAWETMCWAFLVAGLPIIARSVANDLCRRKSQLDFLNSRGADD